MCMKKSVLTFIAAVVLLSCNTVFKSQSVQYSNYRIQAASPGNAMIAAMIKPYADSMNKSMNDVVGAAEITLEKKQPESTLGNFMADAMLAIAKETLASHADAAFVNYGGIRLTQLPAGPVTRGKIFELMPFDNILVVQNLKGDVLQQFLDLVAARGGWPCAGIKMEIQDKKAVSVFIGGKPLNPSAEYLIVNSDFVANGGDNADMLRSIPQQTNGYLVRDAIFEYIAKLKKEGKNISAKLENRVTYAQ